MLPPCSHREITTPYNPQQNGVAKRKNRTIMEEVKTMIHDQDLPMHIWAEVARQTVYVHNRLISHSHGECICFDTTNLDLGG